MTNTIDIAELRKWLHDLVHGPEYGDFEIPHERLGELLDELTILRAFYTAVREVMALRETGKAFHPLLEVGLAASVVHDFYNNTGRKCP